MKVAIDGFSACGKSTLAKSLAKFLDATYIDTGAMYRAVTWYFLKRKIDITSERDVAKALRSIDIQFDTRDGKNDCILNGQNVEEIIRGHEINDFVSEVAAISTVRRWMVDLQREMGENDSVVMDGRDIGTVVFPLADHKFFITADPGVRAKRRLKEYQAKGVEANLEDIKENLAKRDHIDSTREDSPLREAADSIRIDNSKLSRKEQFDLVKGYISESQ